MIRRFQTYTFLPGTTDALRARLAEVLAGTERHIAEVEDCAVGWNRSTAATELVWEHAFASPEAYRRYMVHPYHVDLIDRYVLPDSPERVVETIRGAGLFGYHCDGPVFHVDAGARRVVQLRLAGGTTAEAFAARVAEAGATAGARLSWVGTNTMAACWFDGETPLPGPPPRWTHVWEQAFDDMAALQAHVEGDGASLLAQAGAERATELHYTLERPATLRRR